MTESLYEKLEASLETETQRRAFRATFDAIVGGQANSPETTAYAAALELAPSAFRPVLELERADDGHLFVGLTEFDSEGYGVRACVLARQPVMVADLVMRREFDDMVRLMGDNVRVGKVEA